MNIQEMATSREQSAVLESIGLKPETADMHWWNKTAGIKGLPEQWELEMGPPIYEGIDMPAWSLNRLLKMIPKSINGYDFSLTHESASYQRTWIGNNLCSHTGEPFESCISMIEWFIRYNHMNEDLLRTES